MIVQKVIRHGHCLAVIIPAEAYQAMNIKRGDLVCLVFPSENHIMLDFLAPRTYNEKALEMYKEQHKIIKNA